MERQSTNETTEGNVFIQEFEDVNLTTDEAYRDSEKQTEELKPSPRYGHAACRYEG